ncbi:MAG: hypothetical protein PHC56_10875 [Herbinix sp.]|nr:hypothetical protein [Herbinix sp.]
MGNKNGEYDYLSSIKRCFMSNKDWRDYEIAVKQFLAALDPSANV